MFEEDETLSQRTTWGPTQIIELLETCLETHLKTIDGQIFTLADGTPIGKPISGELLRFI